MLSLYLLKKMKEEQEKKEKAPDFKTQTPQPTDGRDSESVPLNVGRDTFNAAPQPINSEQPKSSPLIDEAHEKSDESITSPLPTISKTIPTPPVVNTPTPINPKPNNFDSSTPTHATPPKSKIEPSPVTYKPNDSQNGISDVKHIPNTTRIAIIGGIGTFLLFICLFLYFRFYKVKGRRNSEKDFENIEVLQNLSYVSANDYTKSPFPEAFYLEIRDTAITQKTFTIQSSNQKTASCASTEKDITSVSAKSSWI